MNTLRRLVVGLVCSRGFLNYQRFRTSLPLIIFRFYSTHLINPIQVGIKSTSRGTSLLEHLSKALEDVKHDTKLLHWDSRSPTEISEQCTHMNTKYQELPENLKETMEGFKLNKLYMLVFSSNKVEGLQISLGDTMRLLQTWAAKSEAEIVEELKNTPQQTKHGEPPVKRVVLQHFLAACHLCEKPPPLTEDLIKHEHKVLMDGLLDDDGRDILAGEYRTEDIMTQGRLFIPPKYVPEAMTTLIKDFKYLEKAGLDTYMLAGWLMAEFVTIHPFNDGNGRMCRLLLNYVFRLRGLPFYCPIAVTKEQRSHYMRILKNYQKFQFGNTRGKYGGLYAYIVSVVESEWSNFSSNIETIKTVV